MTDKEIMSKIAAGDEPTFGFLVSQYQDMILNTCNSFLRNREDAEDIAQDVFVEAFKGAANFRGEAKISTWLYRIAMNKSLNLLRKNKRQSTFSQLGGDTESGNSPFSIPDTNTASAQKKMEQDEDAAELFKALELLPESQRTAFTLHKFENLSYKQMSEIMETSLPSIESLMHRAKTNLKKYLRNYYESEIKSQS